MNELAALLPWLNLIVVPALVYVVRLERRMARLEMQVEFLVELLGTLPPLGRGITRARVRAGVQAKKSPLTAG